MLGIFVLGSSFGNMLGGPFNGLLLGLDGAASLAGWQWVFIGSCLPALLLTFVVLAYVPSSPQTAHFLSEGEKQILAAAHARQPLQASMHGSPWAALWDPRVLAFGFIYVLYATSFYGVAYWLPTIVHTFGVSPSMNGLLNMVPWAIGAIALLIVPQFLRDNQAVFLATTCLTLLGACCFVISLVAPDNTLRFIALAIGGPCIVLLSPCFWTFPPRFFSGAKAAASIAAINSIGNFGGFLAQNAVPWLELQTGRVLGPMLVPASCLAALFVGSSLIWLQTVRRPA